MQKEQAMMNRHRLFLLVLAILAVAGVSCSNQKSGGKKGASPQAKQRISIVKRGDFQERISATGNLEALVEVEVKSNVEGEIVKLLVDEGDYVEAGQILLELDPKRIIEDKRQAEANVDAAKASVKQAELNTELKRSQLATRLTEAENNFKIAKSNLTTTKAESESRLISAETDIQTTKNNLEQDQLSLEQARLSLNQAKLTLIDNEASLVSSEVNLANAKSERDRNKDLFEKKFVSKKALEETETRFASATSQHNSSKQRVAAQKQTIESQKKTVKAKESIIGTRNSTLRYQKLNLEKLREMRKAQEQRNQLQLDIAKTQLDQTSMTTEQEQVVSEQSKIIAEAGLLRNESSLETEKERLNWTTIRAPISGTITTLELEEGEIVTSGRSAFSQSPPLMTISDLSQMVVKTYINEVDMEKLKMDQLAEIVSDTYKGRIYQGRVVEISPIGVERDNIISFEIMIEVIDSPPELRPGMSTDVDIITYEEKAVLLVPIEAVQGETTVTATAQVGASASNFKSKQSVQLMSITGKTFNGTVTSVQGGQLSISLDSIQRGLRPGLQAFAILVKNQQILDGAATTIKIKRDKYVMIAGGENPIRTPVTIGMQNEVDAVVLSGLNEKDRVMLQNRTSVGGGSPWGGGK
ncbi:TPA: hypothetical protein DHW51_07695 [Candidatus Poribacteria bacterium]|nr:hypothetical protein [Candidatus Poribacteria bacterium]